MKLDKEALVQLAFWYTVGGLEFDEDGLVRFAAEVLRLNGVGGEAATIAGLESATGHLSALVDDLRWLMARAMANMKALHDSAQPVDEPRGDFDARVPCDVFRRFVDEHAELLHDLHHSPHELPEAAPQPQQAAPITWTEPELLALEKSGWEPMQCKICGEYAGAKKKKQKQAGE